jgi:glycosyltransferase involved in cell wall biosynthesis
MNKRYRILCVGPMMPPIHGQSLAFTRLCEHLEYADIDIIDTNMTGKKWGGKLWQSIKIGIQIIRSIVRGSYNIVYFTCSRSLLGSIRDVLLIQCARLKSIKIVNHLHGSDFYSFLHNSPQIYQKILVNTYHHVDTSIVLLDAMRDQFQDFPNMKIKVVHNFYDNELTHTITDDSSSTVATSLHITKNESDPHPTSHDTGIHLLYLSNIMKTKGIFELITAFKNLVHDSPQLYLTIAGSYVADDLMSIDEVKEYFQQSIKSCTQINYVGRVYGEQKAKLLQRSDIFILPSYYKSEAFPISIIEAMACGNAIITTKYKYLPTIVQKDHGILVEIRSAKALQKAIHAMLICPEKLAQYQNHNRTYACQHYSLSTYIQSICKILLAK